MQLMTPGDCRCSVCFTKISDDTATRFENMCPWCWYEDTYYMVHMNDYDIDDD